MAARIITLQKKPVLPEEIDGDLIEESMDFSSEFLSRFEEEVKSNRILIEEKDKMLRAITEQKTAELEKKDEIIAERDQTIEIQKGEKLALEAELEKYHKREEEARKRKQLKKSVLRFIWSIIWKALIIAGITLVAIWVEKKVDNSIPLIVGGAIDICCVAYGIWSAVKKDFKKCFDLSRDQ